MKTGCPFGRENRIMIQDLKENVGEIKDILKAVDSKITDLFNHQSSRLPPWTAFWITFLASIAVGSAVALIK